jgi:peptide/nickel transport system substrate-binding protein
LAAFSIAARSSTASTVPTAGAALQSGEIDWLEGVLPDLVPALRKNPNITVAINDPRGLAGRLVMNHLFPPFNDVRARRAILMAISQEDYMRAFVGDDDGQWKPMAGCFARRNPQRSAPA